MATVTRALELWLAGGVSRGTGACPEDRGLRRCRCNGLDVGLGHVDIFWQLCDGPSAWTQTFPPKESAGLHGGACSRQGVCVWGADPFRILGGFGEGLGCLQEKDSLSLYFL